MTNTYEMTTNAARALLRERVAEGQGISYNDVLGLSRKNGGSSYEANLTWGNLRQFGDIAITNANDDEQVPAGRNFVA